MAHQEIVQLADRFRRLELHAAHSGRETRRALEAVMAESRATTLSELTEELHENIGYLLQSLPPYAPPLNSINRALLYLEDATRAGLSLEEVKHRQNELEANETDPIINREKIARYLIDSIPQDGVVYTHTLSETILGVLIELHLMGKLKRVIVTESRPNNDGWETARRLAEIQLPVCLTIDAAMPAALEKAHLMLSGAEIINLDGSVVGKIGAHLAAMICERYSKPLYIIADTSKINYIGWGDFYLTSLSPKDLGLNFSHPELQVSGSLFDITPAELISGYATEKGIVNASEIPSIISDKRVSRWLMEQLSKRL